MTGEVGVPGHTELSGRGATPLQAGRVCLRDVTRLWSWGPTREALPRGGLAAAGHSEQCLGLSLPTRPPLAPAPSSLFFSPIFEDKCAESLAPTLALLSGTSSDSRTSDTGSEQPRLPLARWPPGASRHGPASLTGQHPRARAQGTCQSCRTRLSPERSRHVCLPLPILETSAKCPSRVQILSRHHHGAVVRTESRTEKSDQRRNAPRRATLKSQTSCFDG